MYTVVLYGNTIRRYTVQCTGTMFGHFSTRGRGLFCVTPESRKDVGCPWLKNVGPKGEGPRGRGERDRTGAPTVILHVCSIPKRGKTEKGATLAHKTH